MRDKMLLSLKNKCVIYILSVFLIITSIIPYLLTLIYALPAADDFCYAYEIEGLGGPSLTGIFNMIRSFYQSRQGVFWGVILEGGIDPMHRMGLNGINIVLFLTIILCIVIIGALVRNFCMFHYMPKGLCFFYITVFLWGCLNTRILKEIIFWYGGVCNYTIPLLTGLLGILCLTNVIKNIEDKRKNRIYCLFSMLLGFLSGGGSLQIAGYVCWIYLLFVIWSILEKRCWKITLAAFMMTFLGALINVAAPGNYIRQSGSYEKISLVKAVYYTLVAVVNEIGRVFSQTYIPWLLLVVVIVAFIFLKPVKEKLYHPVIVGGAVFISLLISTFPVCYGYADSSLAPRGYETLDIYMVSGLFFFVNSLVNWLKLKKIALSKETMLAMAILSVINIGYLQSSVPFTTIPGMQCWKQLLSGELKRYHDEWIEVFNTIENSEDDIVKAPISQWAYEADMVVMRPGMSENFEKWVNGGIAIYYGKEKVCVVIQDKTGDDE